MILNHLFSVQDWIYTHGQQIRQQQHCLSLSTTFPASQVLLLPCNMADGKQVGTQTHRWTRTHTHTQIPDRQVVCSRQRGTGVYQQGYKLMETFINLKLNLSKDDR